MTPRKIQRYFCGGFYFMVDAALGLCSTYSCFLLYVSGSIIRSVRFFLFGQDVRQAHNIYATKNQPIYYNFFRRQVVLQKGDLVECGVRFEQAVVSRCATSPHGISPTTRPVVGAAPAAAILKTADRRVVRQAKHAPKL
jgi:hypothetical protein